MSNQRIELKQLEDAIIDVLDDYVNEVDQWSETPFLILNPEEGKAWVDMPGSHPGCEEFPINGLLYIDDRGKWQPDYDAVFDRASLYFDLRMG